MAVANENVSLKDSDYYEMKLLNNLLKGNNDNDHTVHQESELNPEVLVRAMQEFIMLVSTGPQQ